MKKTKETLNLLENELDDLLFSTQMANNKQSDIMNSYAINSKVNINNYSEKQWEDDPEFLSNTIAMLSYEIKNLSEVKESWLQQCDNQKSIIQSLRQEICVLKSQNNDYKTKIQSLTSSLSKSTKIQSQITSKLHLAQESLNQSHAKFDSELKNLHQTHLQELSDLKSELSSCQKQLEISNKAEEITEIVQKLSILLLSRSDSSHLSPNQQYLFKSLFGNTATEIYKAKIEEMEKEIEKLKKEGNHIDYLD